MQRRTLLKLGLVSGTVLALAGGAAMLVQPGLVQRRLTDAGRALFIGVGRAILQGTLPPDPAEQRQALEGMADRVDILAQNLPPHVVDELSQLVGLLGSSAGRVALAGLSTGWLEATPEQVMAALNDMRYSRLTLRQQAYQALHEIVGGAYFSEESTWAVVGYPGPQDI
ncbi:MAG TPA: hypothetical protein PK363_09780 [Giesbergeria sp.]|jgi:hypothetical protein|nr:hypothetical protein [Giesbergeria sp.]